MIRNRAGRSSANCTYATATLVSCSGVVAETSPLLLMLTGGITRRETAEAVLASGVALIGMGTAITLTPDLSNRWRSGHEATERPQPGMTPRAGLRPRGVARERMV